jgi:hypothetical protein
MSLLNFNNSEQGRSGEKKTLSIILGIGALIGAIALGSTLAASINLNSGTPVEFGQGVAQATACDDSVVVTPQSTFFNSEEDAGFIFSSFSVTDVSSACDGKVFTIKAYKNGQNGPLDLYTTEGVAEPFSEVQVLDTAGSFTLIGAGLLSDDIQDISTGFNVNLSTGHAPVSTAIASAQDVDRITIESRDVTGAEAPVVYLVGDIGPGGGVIYYVDNTNGFSCGSDFTSQCHYLEVAPNGWNGGAEPSRSWAVLANWQNHISGIADDGGPYNNALGIGLGFKNSIEIVTQGNDVTSAAGLARSYEGGSKHDWYLPSTAELNLLCQWNRGVTPSVSNRCSGGTLNSAFFGADTSGFIEDVYWSSSQQQFHVAHCQAFEDGNQRQNYKGDSYYVRPIRAF